MIEQIKQLRVEIDGLAQLCEGLKPITEHRLEMVDIPVPEHPMYIGHVETLPKKVNTEEIREAIKSLKLSKAWLGKVLESLGSENPYGSGYKTVEDIVPETDKAKIVLGLVNPTKLSNKIPRLKGVDGFCINGKSVTAEGYSTHIQRVDWIRAGIQEVITTIKPLLSIPFGNTVDYQTIILQNLQEARFWLGFELGRIRDESK